jgi:hypothetical protein
MNNYIPENLSVNIKKVVDVRGYIYFDVFPSYPLFIVYEYNKSKM